MELIHIANATFSSAPSPKPRQTRANTPMKASLEMGVKTKNLPDC